GADPELVDLAKQSLAPELKDRITDAGVLSQRITGYLEGVQERLRESELAKAEAELRAEENQKRKKLYLAIAGLMLLLAVGGGVISANSRRLADAQTQLAREASEDAKEQSALRQIAEKRLKVATVLQLSAESKMAQDASKQNGLKIAIEAAKLSRDVDSRAQRVAHSTLLQSMGEVGGMPLSRDRIGSAVNVLSSSFSPDGKWLITGNRLWRMKQNGPPNKMVALINELATEATIDPTSRWAAVGTYEGKLYLFDLHAPDIKATVQALEPHDSEIRTLTFSPNGRRLASSADQEVKVWDMTQPFAKKPLQTLQHSARIEKLAFDPSDGKHLAAGDSYQSTTLWTLRGGQFSDPKELAGGSPIMNSDGTRLATLGVNEANVWALGEESFDEDPITLEFGTNHSLKELQTFIGPTLVFEHRSNRLMKLAPESLIWDLDDPKAPSIPLDISTKRLSAISLDDRWLVGRGTDPGSANVWDMKTGLPAKEPHAVLSGHTDYLTGITISPDSRWILTSSIAAEAPRLWDLSKPDALHSSIVLSGGNLFQGTRFSHDGKYLVNQSFNTDLKWDVRRFVLAEDGSPPSSWKLPTVDGTQKVSISLDGLCTWRAVGSKDGTVSLYDLGQQDPRLSKSFVATNDVPIEMIQVSKDGTLVATYDQKKNLRLWDLRGSTSPPASTLVASEYSMENNWTLVISGDNRWISALSESGVDLWEISTGSAGVECQQVTLPVTLTGVVRFSPDSRWMVSGNTESLLLFDLAGKGAPFDSHVRLSGNGHHASAASFSSDSTRLVTKEAYQNIASAWDLKSGDIAASEVRLTGHTSTILGLAIHGSGLVATGGQDGTMRVWNLDDEDPSEHEMVLGGMGRVHCVDFHPDGQTLAYTYTGRIRLCDLDLDRAIQRAETLLGNEPSHEEKRLIIQEFMKGK
ncbi:MAG: hypothetical protein AB8B91_05835, partial [Rubripirellula sp.]